MQATDNPTLDQRNQRATPKALWLLFAIALAIRVALIAVSTIVHRGEVTHPAEFGDAGNYMDYGVLFASGLEPREDIFTQRDRLLPFILGCVFRFTGRSILAAQITSALFATAGLFLLFPLAREFLSERWSLLVCVIWVMDPSFVGQSCLPLSENIATPLVIGSLLLSVRARRRNAIGLLIASGCLLVAAAFARSSTFLMTGAIVLWILGWPVTWRRRVGLAICYGAIMIGGWTSSCYISYRLFGLFTPNTHTYSLWGHAAAKIMVRRGLIDSMPNAKKLREQEAREELPGSLTLQEFLEAKRARDIAYIMQYPALHARNLLQAVVATTIMPDRWSIPVLLGIHRDGGIWHRPVGILEKVKLAMHQWGPVVVIHMTLHTILTLSLWAGILLAIPSVFKGDRRAVACLLFMVLAAVIVSGAINVEATPRYRLPAVPMMAMLAAIGFDRLKR